ncbi:hypothetical protein D3C76_1441620 [compost metagenome]
MLHFFSDLRSAQAVQIQTLAFAGFQQTAQPLLVVLAFGVLRAGDAQFAQQLVFHRFGAVGRQDVIFHAVLQDAGRVGHAAGAQRFVATVQ